MQRKPICRYYASSGECFYGADCQFIHDNSSNSSSLQISNHSNNIGGGSHGAHLSKLKATTSGNHGGGQSSIALPPESKLSAYMSLNSSSAGDSAPNSHHQLNMGMNNMSISSSKRGGGSKLASGVGNQPQNSAMNNSVINSTGITNNGLSFHGSSSSFMPSGEVKLELLKKQSLILNFSNGEAFSEIPQRVEHYHDLYPLDGAITTPSNTFNMITTIYKATNMKTGQFVCLRRLHSYNQLSGNHFFQSLDQQLNVWKELDHSNIVKLHNVFFTKEFGDNSLVFVYDYFPIAKTLASQYYLTSNSGLFNNGSGSPTNTNRPYSQQQLAIRSKLLPEPLIWSYIVQISSALRSIHLNGLACRTLDPSKIIITSGFSPEVGQFQPQPMHFPRVKLSSCGIFDVIQHDQLNRELSLYSQKNLVEKMQQEDLMAFGKLCIILACNSTAAIRPENWQQSLDIISRHFSEDLRQLIILLISKKMNEEGIPTKSINDIMPIIGARFYTQLDLSYKRADQIEAELNRELDNSRLFRILAKLGSINERPEHKMDPNWSETGDRYMLKLFRDYLFHQVTDDGRPFLDLGHIICTLNKLDVASPERICLMSRDHQNMLIVSFAELRKCFDQAFNELLNS